MYSCRAVGTIWGGGKPRNLETLPYTTFMSSGCSSLVCAPLVQVREDEKILDLAFLIGPKLYEANWLDLTRDGFLARVKCVEVRCAMTSAFMREYLRAKDARTRRLLYVMNPNKLRAAERLLR